SLYRSIFHLLAPPRDLHSFPTRRSSDLCAHTLCGLFAAALTAMGAHRRRAGRAAARIAGLAWLALTAEFAWARIAPGPRTPGEILRMAVTSVLIPPAACAYRLGGEVALRTGGARGPAPVSWCGARARAQCCRPR